jgi:hypothetical protein
MLHFMALECAQALSALRALLCGQRLCLVQLCATTLRAWLHPIVDLSAVARSF